MGRTTLKWEDVIQLKEIEGYNQHIYGEMAIIFITLLRREELPLSVWFMNCQMSYLPY